jgi:hypothetical protein
METLFIAMELISKWNTRHDDIAEILLKFVLNINQSK